jgi:hypothetical protein
MIVLALGGTASSATGAWWRRCWRRVGLAVNLLVAPPLHVGRRGASGLAERLARSRRARRRPPARLSRRSSRRLVGPGPGARRDVERADRDLTRAEESVRLHPRGSRARGARPRLRAGLAGFEHAYVVVRNLCRALLDRAYFVPEDQQDRAFPEPVREALADVLATLAGATRAAGAFSAATGPADVSRDEVTAALDAVLGQRDRLAGLLAVSPVDDQGAWQQHGALLAAIDRLRVELEAAVHPTAEGWRPAPLTERPREAVRRAVTAPRRGSRRRRGA